ncbi:hypothetical protein GCM10007913_34240 [Devosia yakushimensis]|uniref:DUF1761 domain-containing protein n=1 Tax=Devosia yakushimensis TaxID=470028 RepID=A0ABQ5UHG5_9HYPH|nr:DUF1761 domain-containing protein [Devosia yakushimensis]GLQ11492.1 hypothetical protein GCM10007913_34240 [Devosia yakushimensis]
MSHFAVNWLAVIVAAIVSFAFGAGWYMLLAKPWLAAIGKSREELEGDYTPFIWSGLVLLVMAYFIALLTPALTGATNVGNGLLVGAHMWVGFILTAMILNHRYEGRPWSLTAINGGYLLAVLLIDGLVIGLFG